MIDACAMIVSQLFANVEDNPQSSSPLPDNSTTNS